jgi:phosphonate transport system substrate-binding protein
MTIYLSAGIKDKLWIMAVQEGLMTKRLGVAALLLFACMVTSGEGQAQEKVWSFGGKPLRSAKLTAEYWNPILKYVSKKSGVQLELKVENTAPEHSEKIGEGAYDFAYSNHIFKPHNAAVGYRVIARTKEEPIRGELVVPVGSPIKKMKDLDGKEVGFPSPAAFVAYAVSLDALVRQGVTVKPIFGGNQEGIIAQLKVGKVPAACVNSQIIKEFAERENFKYHIIWQSQEYQNIPIIAHPRVPAKVAAAVRRALVGMDKDPEGMKVLKETAAVIGQRPPLGFLGSSNKEYQNQWDFYRTTVVPELN